MRSKLEVTVVGAKGLQNVELMGVSDPFCQCNVGGSSQFKTPQANGNLEPTWDYTQELPWDGTSDVEFSVFDFNRVKSHTLMGRVVMRKDQFVAGYEGSLKLETKNGKSGGTLEVKIHHVAGVAGLPSPTESDLLMWRSPATSAVVLAAADVALLLYIFYDIKPLALLTNALLLCIGAGGVFKLAGSPLAGAGVGGEMEVIPKASVPATAERLSGLAKRLGAFSRHVMLWEDRADTIKVLVALHLTGVALRNLQLATVVLLCGNLLFSVPVLLETKKDLIDQTLRPHLGKALEKRDELLAKIPKYSDVASRDD